ncbi:homeobox protein HMX2 [Lates japonicus]|uniref:Homeobox protein HMX2 n=1 Tax=Lates japonicus TaxID=270547 RepID=A0AAD3N1C4_LATJO|nr:homeobox protein HMX2 [Lates japonicus]
MPRAVDFLNFSRGIDEFISFTIQSILGTPSGMPRARGPRSFKAATAVAAECVMSVSSSEECSVVGETVDVASLRDTGHSEPYRSN